MAAKALTSGTKAKRRKGMPSYREANRSLQSRGLADFGALNPEPASYPVVDMRGLTRRQREIAERGEESLLAERIVTGLAAVLTQDAYALADFSDAHGLASRARMSRRMDVADRLLGHDDFREIHTRSSVETAALASEGAKRIFASYIRKGQSLIDRELIPVEEEEGGVIRSVVARVLP